MLLICHVKKTEERNGQLAGDFISLIVARMATGENAARTNPIGVA
jgi:hypothetical protein